MILKYDAKLLYPILLLKLLLKDHTLFFGMKINLAKHNVCLIINISQEKKVDSKTFQYEERKKHSKWD